MSIETRTCLVADEKSLILFSLAMAVVLLGGCGRKQQEPSPAQVSAGGQTNALANQPSSSSNPAMPAYVQGRVVPEAPRPLRPPPRR